MTHDLNDVEQGALAVLGADLPGTARLMNDDAIAQEHFLGRDTGDASLTDEQYDEMDAALGSLVEKGMISETEVFGMRTFHLTREGADLVTA